MNPSTFYSEISETRFIYCLYPAESSSALLSFFFKVVLDSLRAIISLCDTILSSISFSFYRYNPLTVSFRMSISWFFSTTFLSEIWKSALASVRVLFYEDTSLMSTSILDIAYCLALI